MSKIDDGGPAFPQAFAMAPKPDQGMSLLDHFAGLAMAALIAEPPWAEGSTSVASRLGTGDTEEDRFATAAYRIADAMLRARAATQEKP